MLREKTQPGSRFTLGNPLDSTGRKRYVVFSVLLMFLLTGCSIRRFAVNKIGDALASGGSTYSSDDDLQLVGEALPFALKLMEGLLDESPKHKGLLITACEGFTTYAYVYVQREAGPVAEQDLARAREMRTRARRLYLRARAYGLRRLEASYKGITERIKRDPRAALSVIKKKDVPALYWNAAALGLGISVSKNDAEMLAHLPEVEALLERAVELDESWNKGALHAFQVTLASAKPGQPDYQKLRKHFDRALDLSGGNQAGLYVSYAEAVSISKQDRSEFVSLLKQALAIDPDQHKEVRLANIVTQKRARWLLKRVDELILDTTSVSEGRISND
ncbi:TRAP transporter TatT component family protein [Acidobacteria bacterium AH-259-D05]|nr:TRAP transporter TatT component family protein [Acidobacteria bacterium AH-259-D05]